MRERLKSVISSGLIDLKRSGDTQVKAYGVIEIWKLYDLVFTIAMKSCFGDLVRTDSRSIRCVFMPGDKLVQENLWSNAERKDQQQYSA